MHWIKCHLREYPSFISRQNYPKRNSTRKIILIKVIDLSERVMTVGRRAKSSYLDSRSNVYDRNTFRSLKNEYGKSILPFEELENRLRTILGGSC